VVFVQQKLLGKMGSHKHGCPQKQVPGAALWLAGDYLDILTWQPKQLLLVIQIIAAFPFLNFLSIQLGVAFN
jgi:hypothetical protein